MGVAYGIKVSGMDNEYVQITHMAMSSLTLTKRPGIFWVDYFPFLRHVPAWVPGATGRKLSNFAKPLVYAMRDRPYAAVKSDYVRLSVWHRVTMNSGDLYSLMAPLNPV